MRVHMKRKSPARGPAVNVRPQVPSGMPGARTARSTTPRNGVNARLWFLVGWPQRKRRKEQSTLGQEGRALDFVGGLVKAVIALLDAGFGLAVGCVDDLGRFFPGSYLPRWMRCIDEVTDFFYHLEVGLSVDFRHW